MQEDPIVNEIRKVRKEHTDRFHGDLHAICEDLRREEAELGPEPILLPAAVAAAGTRDETNDASVDRVTRPEPGSQVAPDAELQEPLLPADSMSEAEVSLLLAIYLATESAQGDEIKVAIDGAQVQIGDREIFPLKRFLGERGWFTNEASWGGLYTYAQGGRPSIRVHSTPGVGNVVATLPSGKTLRAESKKGPLGKAPSSPEFPLMHKP